MKCLFTYKWVKLPPAHLPSGKGLMGSFLRLASRAAFRPGKARYCGYVNEVQAGSWAGGIVGLKSILGIKDRKKALSVMDQLVARLLERDTRTSPGAETVHPFSGMAKCGLCGENMTRKTSHSGGKKYVYFICCHGCKGAQISEDSLTESATAAIRSHIGNIINLECMSMMRLYLLRYLKRRRR